MIILGFGLIWSGLGVMVVGVYVKVLRCFAGFGFDVVCVLILILILD